jgi:hypothetical protein
MVSTSDSDSGNPSSIPGTTFLFLLFFPHQSPRLSPPPFILLLLVVSPSFFFLFIATRWSLRCVTLLLAPGLLSTVLACSYPLSSSVTIYPMIAVFDFSFWSLLTICGCPYSALLRCYHCFPLTLLSSLTLSILISILTFTFLLFSLPVPYYQSFLIVVLYYQPFSDFDGQRHRFRKSVDRELTLLSDSQNILCLFSHRLGLVGGLAGFSLFFFVSLFSTSSFCNLFRFWILEARVCGSSQSSCH